MIAYFVYDDKNDRDIVVLPGAACSVPVDRACLENFISATPDFANWSGSACVDLTPEDFGTVVATREDTGDVCVLKAGLWRARMDHFLNALS